MRFLGWILCLFLLSSCATEPTSSVLYPAQPATEPAASSPATPAPGAAVPSTGPSTSSSAVEADGILEPVDPFEVRLRPKAYAGDLTITTAAANGAAVNAGHVLLQIDPDPLNRQLSAAKNDLVVAQANVDRVEADAKTAADADELSLRQQTDAARQADDGVKWWENVDGPRMLQQQELTLKDTQAQVDDQQDELNQLKKMYKSEELTSATADIVVKRAVRSLEHSQEQLAMTQKQVEKFKAFDYPIEKQKPVDTQTSAHLGLQQLKDAQAQAGIVRKTGLVAAHATLDDAQRKVNDLQADLDKLTVKAPFDGIVAYGSFSQGGFQADPKTLRPSEKVAAQQVLMTLYHPDKVKARVDLSEANFAKLTSGMSASVRSEAFPELKMQGTVDPLIRAPSSTGNSPAAYSAIVALPDVSSQLAPGSKIKVSFGR